MVRIFLQEMIKDIRFEDLPPTWNSFDIESFSSNIKLWDYQQEAVKNAIKVLWKYFQDFDDYKEGETLNANINRKQKFFKWYKDNGLKKDLDISLDRKKREIIDLLREYYPVINGKISYENFINRMGFWMATGSGKSLVIIKLIEILNELIIRKEIPPCDILFLTHRDDLIEQLKRHVNKFNSGKTKKITLEELKKYPEVKTQSSSSESSSKIIVFYYRSDNISDEQKEKVIDFRNYDNEGKWYIILDEAHKGDKEDSKRQHIYSILSRNGFLFNFSATFTDPRDIITTAYEFNLSTFINSGYGKHIYILQQKIRGFGDEKDYNSGYGKHIYILQQKIRGFGDEKDYNPDVKQKIVLKSLILLTYIKKIYEEIKNIQSNLYHKPMLLTLVNSIHKEDADLRLFFRELEKIGKGNVQENIFNDAINELWKEFEEELPFMFEDKKIKIDEGVFKSIKIEDILKYVYNSETSGDIEILMRPSNKKELALKLKTSEKPFALIKIGDIFEWLKKVKEVKKEFEGYEIQESFNDESYFESLDKEDSEINILMGSRGFYEGWDSNRPNVIIFINIGTGEEARKFILQSIGRGVRIEPIPGKRKRLLSIYNANEIEEHLFNQLKDKVLPLETLFIMGTNREALVTVIQNLEKEKIREDENQLSLFENCETKRYELLVPTYKSKSSFSLKAEKQIKFEISNEDFELLKRFVEFITDDRILLVRYDTEPSKIKILREYLKNVNNIKPSSVSLKNVDLLIQRYFNYLSIEPKEFGGLKELEEEIKHFKNIKVYLKDVSEIQRKIESVKDYLKRKKKIESESSKLSEEGRKEIEKLLIKESEEIYEYNRKKIKIKYIANHYYIPLILSEDEKLDFIKHIIKTPSEVKFIRDLENYLSESNNKFKIFDWWMFSKIDESLDEIYIPYYNPNINMISRFYPDFVFWLNKGSDYFILFVDPKGTEYTSAYRKIEGYKELFEENGEAKVFKFNEFNVRIKLFFRTEDLSKVLDEYKKYWFDSIEKMLQNVI